MRFTNFWSMPSTARAATGHGTPMRDVGSVVSGAVGGGRSALSRDRKTRVAEAGVRAAGGVAGRLLPSRPGRGWLDAPAAVSPDGGRAPALLRTAIAGAAALLLGGAVPALADDPVWHDAGAKLPDSVALNAVATGGTAVVAVGTDGADAVAYTPADATWQRSVLPAAAGATHAAALDVALDAAGNGWAVGWQAGDDGVRHALVDRLQGGAWTTIDTGTAPPLDAVAASDSLAYAGDETGRILPLAADGLGTALSFLPPASASAVRSLALTSGADAIAGGAPAGGAAASSALLAVDGANRRVTQAAAVPASAAAQILAVAAAADGTRLAVDGTQPCTVAAGAGPDPVPSAWLADATSGAWQRDAAFPATTGTRLCDATFTATGDAIVVGSFAGRRAVWRRHAGSWARVDDLGAGELRGVAMTGAEGWAVGAGGTLLRFSVPPPPPAADPPPADTSGDGQQPPADQQQSGQQSQQQGADTATQAQQASTPPAEAPAPAPQQPAGPAVDVTTEPRAPKPSSAARGKARSVGRLLGRLAVHRTGRNRLVLRFELRDRAQVTVNALMGKTVVGRSRQVLAAGRHQLILTYRGSHPPTRLDIVVHRLGAGAHAQGGQQ